jgi:hypothetical protein
VIDSVAKKHKSSFEKNGTQCFHVNQRVYIDFEDRGGMMGFEILPFEDGDEQKYDVITITSPNRWTPRKFTQESTTEPYFHDPSYETTSVPLDHIPDKPTDTTAGETFATSGTTTVTQDPTVIPEYAYPATTTSNGMATFFKLAWLGGIDSGYQWILSACMIPFS